MPSSLLGRNFLPSTQGSSFHRNPDGSPPTNVAKGNRPLPSSSPSPVPRLRTLQRDPACLPFQPPFAWNVASVSTILPNAPAASTMATTLSAAPTTLSVDGAPANTSPPITFVQPEKTPLKDDHARTPLLS